MERRIKILYIITIIAILAFLGMQVYWLYGRYEFSLKEYETELNKDIIHSVDEYNSIRERKVDKTSSHYKESTDSTFTIPSFSLHQEYNDTVKTRRTSKLSTYIFSAHKLLGLPPGTPLTTEQKNEAMALAQKEMTSPADSVVFDASGAKDENEAWSATQNVLTERKNPFTTEGIDSVLQKNNIKAKALLVKADSMMWNNRTEYRLSLFTPKVSTIIPYSQLQGFTVKIVSEVNPIEVIPGMWQALLVTVLVSSLLMICLVLQFSTVLKLSRLDKMRNSFITTMIHELKRPLSTLKMCVSGLENERMMEDENTKNELLSETRSALDNLSAYFSKLRDITFNNVEQIPLNLQEVNIRSLINDVASSTIVPVGKEVAINNEIESSLILTIDPTHFTNIMTNLLENAIKYSGKSVKITVSAVNKGEEVEIRLSDTGNGIAQGDLPYIFKRFYRGKASAGDQPGIGLGLSYVKLLVEAHGGEIAVESKVGEGSCFKIIMPL